MHFLRNGMKFIRPQVSIIMPAYNAAEHIEDAINSILNQSFSNFELLITDDKSTDNTVNIIEKFKDPRLKLFKNNKNLGQSITKNAVIRLARGVYIAFMDADDVCHPERLKMQYNLLEKHQEICGTGTFATFINGQGKKFGKVKLPLSSEAIKVHTLFNTSLVHPSIMVRRKEFYDLYELYYNTGYLYAQDFELYSRLVHKVNMINIPEYLYSIRKWSQQISKKHVTEQIDYFITGVKKQLKDVLKIELNEEHEEIVRITCRNREKNTLNENTIEIYFELLKEIWFSNLKYNIYKNSLLKDYLMQRYLDAFSVYNGNYSKYLSYYIEFEKILFNRANLKNRLKMTNRYLRHINNSVSSIRTLKAGPILHQSKETINEI